MHHGRMQDGRARHGDMSPDSGGTDGSTAPAAVITDPIERPENLYAKPPRSAMTPRHMIAAMIPMVLVMLLAGVASRCSFSPGGPSGQGATPAVVDLGRELRVHAPRLGLAVREPSLPEGWTPNSVGTGSVGGKGQNRSIRVGLITDTGHYLRFSQSTARADDLVEAETNERRIAQDSIEVDGVTWRIYPAARAERAWVADVSGVRLLITGSGATDEFRRLATALLAAPIVPSR